jgi:peptidoglycan/xylan/chitin deacetylase (PgdA/CDA1 family)
MCLPRETIQRASSYLNLSNLDPNLLAGHVLPEDVKYHRLLAAYTPNRPTSSRFPFSYQRIPPVIRSLVASALGRWTRRQANRWAVYPLWPLDLSTDLLADLAVIRNPFSGGPAPVILSHDLDSAEGLRNFIEHFADLEKQAGAQSANFIVPCGWAIDFGLLDEIHQRGHEIGIHGYDHSNLTPFVPDEGRVERLNAARPLIERYGIQGYRAPSLLRTPELMSGLEKLYTYDSSIPTSGGPFPVPNNGCASARPFRIGSLVEIPISMPRDGSLRFMGYSPGEIFRLWVQCADLIAASGGVVVLLTHCEDRFSGNKAMREVYKMFLDYVSGSTRFVWSTMPSVVSQYQSSKQGID